MLKENFWILVLLIILSGCQKQVDPIPSLEPMRAGISTGYGIYHIPIEPDLISVHKHYPGIGMWHDLDLQSPYDFRIVSSSQYGGGTNSDMFVAKFVPEPDREIAVVDTIDNMPIPLNYGDLIDSNLTWTNAGGNLYYHRNWSMGGQSSNVYEPGWLGMGTRYIGVRIPRNNRYYYGYYEAIVEKVGDSLYFKLSDAAIQGD
jgi:hypothetical protein